MSLASLSAVTVQTLLAEAESTLRDSQSRSSSPRLDGELLLAHVLGARRAWLRAHNEHEVTDEQQDSYRRLVARCRGGEPVAYILGAKWFWQHHLTVTRDVLVPRPETETLVEALLSRHDQAPRDVADLGTGSGAIAVALASERPAWRITATDRSRAALQVARQNGARYQNIRYLLGDWCEPLGNATFDAIVANPPYIREGDPHLAALRHEPQAALVAGTDGLDAIRHIAGAAPACLKPGGDLFLEHGHDQGEAVQTILAAAGFTDLQTFCDIADLPRVTCGSKPA